EIGSPAIDAGDNPICAAPGPSGLNGIDQRGSGRFHHGDSLCDIGAFEFVDLAVVPNFLFLGSQVVGNVSEAQTVTVTNSQLTSVALSSTIGGADPAEFALADFATCSSTLPMHTSCKLAVIFVPQARGKRSAVLTVSDTPDHTGPYDVALV